MKQFFTIYRISNHIHGYRSIGHIKPYKTSYRKYNTNYEEQGSLGGLLLCCTGAVVTGSLCFWQVKRTSWKGQIIEQRKQQNKKPIQPLNDIIRDAVINIPDDNDGKIITKVKETLEFRNVEISGKYLYDKEVLVGCTSIPVDAQNNLSNEHQKGYYILTPFILKDPIEINIDKNRKINIEKVFINRGWISSQVSQSYLNNPIFENTEEENIYGILHFGIEPHKSLNLITGIAKDAKTLTYQQMYPDGIAKNIKLNFSSFFSNSIEYVFPTIIIDSLLQPPPCKNIPALDVEQKKSNPYVYIKLIRRSINDYTKFYTTPTTHVVYALTWGTLCLFSTYAFLGRYIFRDMTVSHWFKHQKSWYNFSKR